MDDDKIFDKISEVGLKKTMERSYIDYAMSVIAARALPDVRDGLKPVQRRILHSMIELNNGPDKPHRKCARIVGDTMGKYHPHGDSSIYDALVKLAQDWNTRYPLVDGHGNFGSEDGDGAAAMRYTEARLSKISMEMLADINKDTVDFVPNFDETEKEPTVLPSRFPNLLVNGTTGIAVGMATNIPPHNLKEVIGATVKIIDNRIEEDRETSIDEIMQIIKGPDFPMGAEILGRRGIEEAYRTGRGKIKVRAVTDIEAMPNGKHKIVVTELPYMVNKALLIQKIVELVKTKRVEGITDVRDESSREGIRVVIELKKDTNANVLLNQLYKHTQLQDTFGVNMLALVDGVPKILNISQMLGYYLKHQEDVVTRRTKYDLNKAEERAHILKGLLIALDNIDEVINIIRSSKSVQDAKNSLIERFGLTEIQAQAIVDMRLGRDVDEVTDEELIERENIVIAMTKLGYIKRMPEDLFKAQNRGGKGIRGMQTIDEDYIENLIVTTTHNYLMFFTNTGRVYRLKGYEIPEAGRTARGVAIVNLLQLQAGEKITAVIPLKSYEDGKYLFMATRNGMVKKTDILEYQNVRKTGLTAIVLRDNDELIEVKATNGDDDIFLITKKGMSIRFNEKDVRQTGRTSMGVKGIHLGKDDIVISMQMSSQGEKILLVTENGMGKRTLISEFNAQNRGGKGVKCYKITEKTGDLVGAKIVTDENDVMIITTEGIIIRTSCDGISTLGRVTSGVKIINLNYDNNVKVASMTEVQKEEFDDEDPEGENPEETEDTEVSEEQSSEEDSTEE